MTSQSEKLHPVVHRTSPKGGPFIGKCGACGKEGITWAQLSTEECPNPDGMTQEQALIEGIEGPKQ